MMDHMPYEEWLYNQDELTIEQRIQLYEHLESCEMCQVKETAWRKVETLLADSPMIQPTDGFANRWRVSMTPRIELERRNQIFKTFIILSGMAFICLSVLGFQFLYFGSPVDWLINSIQSGVRMLAYSSRIVDTVMMFAKQMPPFISFALAGIIGITFVLFSGIWVLWLTKIDRIQGVAQNEK